MMRTADGSRPRAAVIGGSISGLLAALLLRHNGWAVDVYERVPGDLSGRGAGIVTHAPLWQALDTVGIDWRDNLGSRSKPAGCSTSTEPHHRDRRAQTLSAWDRLYSLLRSALPAAHYHQGKELVRVEQDHVGVGALFADGTRAQGDLLVGCDGLRSTVRAQFLPDVRPLYAGYVAWRGLVPEDALAPDLHADDFHASCILPAVRRADARLSGRRAAQ